MWFALISFVILVAIVMMIIGLDKIFWDDLKDD